MPWVKVDEGMPENPKIIGLGPAVKWAHVEAICYCARNLTDGRVPAAAARRMATATGIRQLIEAGLWERDGADYVVHDYLEYNPSREQVMSDRAAARERMAKARGSSADVHPNNGRSSPNPSPTPIPSPVSDSVPEPTVPEISDPPTPRPRRGRPQPVDEEFIAGLVVEYAETWTEAEVRERVEAAMNHRAYDGWKDKRIGVKGWLRRDASRETPRRPTPLRPFTPTPIQAACAVDGCDHSNRRSEWLCLPARPVQIQRSYE